MYDGTFPKSLDGTSVGKNMKGFKGKAVLLWPYHAKGKHDPAGKWAGAKCAEAYAKALKTKPIDSYTMTDGDVAAKILACST